MWDDVVETFVDAVEEVGDGGIGLAARQLPQHNSEDEEGIGFKLTGLPCKREPCSVAVSPFVVPVDEPAIVRPLDRHLERVAEFAHRLLIGIAERL